MQQPDIHERHWRKSWALKLDLKFDFQIEPEYYLSLFEDMPVVLFLKERKTKKNFIQYFTRYEKGVSKRYFTSMQ